MPAPLVAGTRVMSDHKATRETIEFLGGEIVDGTGNGTGKQDFSGRPLLSATHQQNVKGRHPGLEHAGGGIELGEEHQPAARACVLLHPSVESAKSVNRRATAALQQCLG